MVLLTWYFLDIINVPASNSATRYIELQTYLHTYIVIYVLFKFMNITEWKLYDGLQTCKLQRKQDVYVEWCIMHINFLLKFTIHKLHQI